MNPDLSAIESRLAVLLRSYLEAGGNTELENYGEITSATNLVSDFTLDSFQVMEYLMEVEETFDIMIDMNSLSNTHTIGDLAKIVATAQAPG